ncbi:conserved membrane protein of unknown function [Petrocella atlantisensis]|uniref:Uncharacterized protein n=1 Tax=Petrocella atlantisensis TaxID=2173034 RepID=A0A3P7NS14_9FIRM|nr:conserved membrane protein of unknown function [Petrocella atlantisensis]
MKIKKIVSIVIVLIINLSVLMIFKNIDYSLLTCILSYFVVTMVAIFKPELIGNDKISDSSVKLKENLWSFVVIVILLIILIL